MCTERMNREKDWELFYGKYSISLVPLQVDTQKQFSVTLQPFHSNMVPIAIVNQKLYLLIEIVYRSRFRWAFLPGRPENYWEWEKNVPKFRFGLNNTGAGTVKRWFMELSLKNTRFAFGCDVFNNFNFKSSYQKSRAYKLCRYNMRKSRIFKRSLLSTYNKNIPYHFFSKIQNRFFFDTDIKDS